MIWLGMGLAYSRISEQIWAFFPVFRNSELGEHVSRAVLFVCLKLFIYPAMWTEVRHSPPEVDVRRV